MGRKQKIKIDHLGILKGIQAAQDEHIDQLRTEAAEALSLYENNRQGHFNQWTRYCNLTREITYRLEFGTDYDIARFFGSEPTQSETVRIRQSVRQSSKFGLVRLNSEQRPTLAAITEEGRGAYFGPALPKHIRRLMELGIPCDHCGSRASCVTRTTRFKTWIRRERRCESCGTVFMTSEKVIQQIGAHLADAIPTNQQRTGQ